MASNYVIFDCDGGSDDAWALLLLLKAAEQKRLVLLAVTICGSGNTDLRNATRNIMRILRACNKQDEIPIYLGAAESLIPAKSAHKHTHVSCELFHGKDGFGDVLPQDEQDNLLMEQQVKREHAVMAINQFCVKRPGAVTIIAVGPLTNIALCHAMYGEQFAQQVKDLYIMGGNYQGVGNYTRCAEFNFYSDAEAAHIVLEKSKCPITILPWEPCMDERFFICIKWRLEELGLLAAPQNAAIEILNKVEHAQWIPRDFKSWNPCDAMLVGAFLFPTQFISKESLWHATVDIKSEYTHGLMILDHLHKYPKNVRIIEAVDAEFFKSIAQWVAGLKELKTFTACQAVNGAAKSV